MADRKRVIIRDRVSCGNAGAVESVESQKQASHSSHEPLGNLAKNRRDSHIPTAPTTIPSRKTKKHQRAGYRPPPAAARCAASGVIVVDREK